MKPSADGRTPLNIGAEKHITFGGHSGAGVNIPGGLRMPATGSPSEKEATSMNPSQTSNRSTESLAPDQSLQHALHRLWSDHVVWTRNYVVSAISNSPDVSAAATRLMRNQEDIGRAIVPIYGEEAGTALTALLNQHILIAVDLVAAARTGDKERFAEEDSRWDANAADIAEFLAGANPNWPQKDVHDLIAQHLQLTRDEVVARLSKDWAKDVAAFDDIMTEILTLADTLSDGIVRQFPEKFGGHANGKLAGPAWSLRRAMDRLWIDHVNWTRNFVIAGLVGAADAETAASRLLRNQEDIGNAIVPFYGEQAGAGLALHLKQHILIAAEMVEMAHNNQFGDRFEELERGWSQNASHIAGFLNGLNPNWPVKDVEDLLEQHLSLTLGEVKARFEQDWEADVAAFDDILTEILTLSAALCDGLVAQFPERFAETESTLPRPKRLVWRPLEGLGR